jgi:hypothetical protein
VLLIPRATSEVVEREGIGKEYMMSAAQNLQVWIARNYGPALPLEDGPAVRDDQLRAWQLGPDGVVPHLR